MKFNTLTKMCTWVIFQFTIFTFTLVLSLKRVKSQLYTQTGFLTSRTFQLPTSRFSPPSCPADPLIRLKSPQIETFGNKNFSSIAKRIYIYIYIYIYIEKQMSKKKTLGRGGGGGSPVAGPGARVPGARGGGRRPMPRGRGNGVPGEDGVSL